MVKQYPYLIGDFMWTAWDYLGEAGIGAWSYTGGMPFWAYLLIRRLWLVAVMTVVQITVIRILYPVVLKGMQGGKGS